MSEDNSVQEVKRWKQQYFDQLDLFESRQKDWQALESVLIKTVLRLSITAEGQHASIDRYLQEIRAQVKKQISIISLENILDDISAVVSKLGDRQSDTKADRKADAQATADKKIISLLQRLINEIELPEASSKQKNSLLKKLTKATDKDSEALFEEVKKLFLFNINTKLNTSNNQAESGLLSKLFQSRKNHQDDPTESNGATVTTKPFIEAARDNHIEGKQAEIKHTGVRRQELNADKTQPSVQQALLDLLQKLEVPDDLADELNSLRQRIETANSASGWKQILNEVSQLINRLRSQMLGEKQEFETFLQQITSRLKEIDEFLLIENSSLKEAEQACGEFDAVINVQVQDIHKDMNIADNLHDLKTRVENRLNIVSDHIRQYRVEEQDRYTRAQQNVQSMQSRLKLLEQESGNLRQVIHEKSREAMYDALTGIPNRLSYEKKALEEIARCKRFAEPMSMAIWDIDHFKQVNDTYGHKVGDMVLKAVARLLEERMRETDFIARYGGEEFVMFLPGAEEVKALAVTELLREKIAACNFNHQGEIIKISVSCGISGFIEGDTHESIFERADRALYVAKDSGRNKCIAASSLS